MTLSSNYSTKKFTLNNGTEMPAVGFGTYRIRNGDVIKKVVEYALDAGYRMFDTAAVYGNEQHLKEAFKTLLPKFELEREDIFVTTKLSPSDHGGGGVTERAYLKSLNNLGLEYVDLYLVHFPGTTSMAANDPRNEVMRDLIWAGLADLYANGKVKAIGVSNYTVRHLKQLLKHDHGVVPAVNQVEWHPYYFQNELLEFCKQNDIVLQAYCSLGGASAYNFSLIEEPIIKKIATKLNVTPGQVLLQWALQQDVAIIPKSVNPDHIKQNIALNFTMSPEDIKAINSLSSQNTKYAWDPAAIA